MSLTARYLASQNMTLTANLRSTYPRHTSTLNKICAANLA